MNQVLGASKQPLKNGDSDQISKESLFLSYKLSLQVDKRMQRFVTAPKIMFKASMDEAKWRQVDECCAMLLKDFRARTILLLKRLDVSVNSFLWFVLRQ